MRPLDDRSVSDVLAFVVVFSIIITSVGLVYGVGFSSLSDFQQGEQKTNAVRAFDALSTGFDNVQHDRSPASSGAIQLNGGTIQVEEQTEFEVSVEDSSGSTVWGPQTNTTGSLRYTIDGTYVAYESGAVFRKDRGSSAMVSEPSFVCSDDRAVVSLVAFDGLSGARGGDTNVEVITRRESNQLLYSYPDGSGGSGPDSVVLSIDDSEYGDAWERYLVENGWQDLGGGEYSCSADVVVVRVTVVTVEFQ
ncbi:DUF7289 family protein [Haloarchaeobius sp. HRN-SO-5]|uniref:DUF7289 family protein n=1 Tax=Haloarchaeobius sp. HRN-SO-5 TaxID=3446118 RepID=UPI003EBEFF91